MSRKNNKIGNPLNDENIELRRLKLEEEKISLEKNKFEHQKQIDVQRLEYDAKKAPPNVTKWLAIAAIIISGLSPVITGYVQNRSASLAYEGKGMELKTQESLKVLDLRYGMTMHLMNNWKTLNNMRLDDKRNFATLIKGFFPEEQSFQIFEALERNSPSPAKAFWREAKSSVVNTSTVTTAEIAPKAVEKTNLPAQEIKQPEFLKSMTIGTYSAEPAYWSLSNTSQSPRGTLTIFDNTNGLSSAYDGKEISSQKSGRPASLIDGVNGHLFGQSTSFSLADFPMPATQSNLTDTQVSLAIMNRQPSNSTYGVQTFPSLNLTAMPNQTGLLTRETVVNIGYPPILDGSAIRKNLYAENESTPIDLGAVLKTLQQPAATPIRQITQPSVIDVIRIEKITQPVQEPIRIRVQ